jgi:hypothetical protein
MHGSLIRAKLLNFTRWNDTNDIAGCPQSMVLAVSRHTWVHCSGFCWPFCPPPASSSTPQPVIH